MLTQEQKMAICEEYKDRKNKVEAIAQKYGIMRGQVTRIAVEGGAEPRVAKKYGKKLKAGGVYRACPTCKRTIDVKGARFCCFCGSDIRSNKEILVEKINRAFGVIQHLPATKRDEMQQLFLEIIKELSKD